MFKNQRQGNPLYILHKGNTPFCEVGSIVSVSPPRPENPNFNMYGPQAKIVVDIKAKVGEDNVSFSNVLSDVTITDYPTTNGEKLVVSCDLGALNTETYSRKLRELIEEFDAMEDEDMLELAKEAYKLGCKEGKRKAMEGYGNRMEEDEDDEFEDDDEFREMWERGGYGNRGGGRGSSGGGYGNRRGVPGTGRYSRRYRR